MWALESPDLRVSQPATGGVHVCFVHATCAGAHVWHGTLWYEGTTKVTANVHNSSGSGLLSMRGSHVVSGLGTHLDFDEPFQLSSGCGPVRYAGVIELAPCSMGRSCPCILLGHGYKFVNVSLGSASVSLGAVAACMRVLVFINRCKQNYQGERRLWVRLNSPLCHWLGLLPPGVSNKLGWHWNSWLKTCFCAVSVCRNESSQTS